MKKFILTSICLFLNISFVMAINAHFSMAGFYEKENTGRSVYNMNIGWRFYKGPVKGGQEMLLDDSAWEKVSLPHGLEVYPYEASGGANYQGEAWYRKYFTVPKALSDKKIFLYFEAIMGKSEVWINGQLAQKHYGGYLPVIVDASQYLKPNQENLIAVKADNSDDPLVPPGKAQDVLDYCYFGGIYRDCWMIACNSVHITDANYENKRDAGLFVHYSKATDKEALMNLQLNIKNETAIPFNGKVIFSLKTEDNKEVAKVSSKISIKRTSDLTLTKDIQIKHPELWNPESPYLYNLEISVLDNKNKCIDGYVKKVGIKTVELKGADGLWLNGKPYPSKIIGLNRHQDFATIGNALTNSLHWRDVKKMREAGIRIIRSHYPQDPAFMEACDEMGMFVIVSVPGWQYWTDEPIFAERIYSDLRNMVRRDRNNPSVLFWEPILNETRFPESFALNAKKIIEEEYPYAGGHYTAIDPGSKGSASYPIIYTHPLGTQKAVGSGYNISTMDKNKTYFTREFGDNVDDWNAQNSNSRVHRSWGEVPMLIQAQHYADPTYNFTCLEKIYETPRAHIGGALWHSFDHQRGYHPQPFYGGIMDGYRQAKTSYYMFMSQRPDSVNKKLPVNSGPMIYIANEMSPFSPSDVTVYSNCEEVHLKVFAHGKEYSYKRSSVDKKMPSPIIVFKDAYNFMETKASSRANKQDDVYMLAEGLIGGKVVTTFKRVPSRRPDRLRLYADTLGLPVEANGSDKFVVVAELVDKNGTVKRMSNHLIKFSIEGDANILSAVPGNLVPLQWGSAPIVIQAGYKTKHIKVKAEILEKTGSNSIQPGVLDIDIVPSKMKFLQKEIPVAQNTLSGGNNQIQTEAQKKAIQSKLKEVEKQQDYFGEKR